jgi:hypothetical protein
MSPGPHTRFGRDVIFYSSHVDEFRLPNGVTVLTVECYDREDLLEERQEFYTFVSDQPVQSDCLGISRLNGPSHPLNRDGSNSSELVMVTNATTIIDSDSADSAFIEFWVSNGNTHASD